jgi:hemoglobin
MERSREDVAALRAKVRQDAADIGIDEAFIALMVDTFYARIREDAVLGPIFAARIDDWPHHLARMRAFWSSVLLHSGSFSGNPMLKHVAIPDIGRNEFVHWLTLFEATLSDVASHPDASAAVIAKARMIAESLYSGIQMHRDGVRDPSRLKSLGQAA